MGYRVLEGMGFVSRALAIALVVCVCMISIASAQGFPPGPYAPSPFPGGDGLNLAPSNPLGPPGSTEGIPPGPDSILVTPQLFQGILPLIPNLQAGYLYNFGKNIQTGRLTLDYLLPIRVGRDSAVFGEFHTEWQDLWRTVTRGANSRVDLSLGGGFRTIFNKSTFVGVNGFWDTTKVGGFWFDAGAVGIEMAALLPDNRAVDLNFNWYSQRQSDLPVLKSENHSGNFDLEAGFSSELWCGGPDLRLHGTWYKFDVGEGVNGWRAGADLRSPDGVFRIKYEASGDRINNTYHTIGAYVNVGFQLSNIFCCRSPFTPPEPVFICTRNMRKEMTDPPHRRWSMPSPILAVQAGGAGTPSPTLSRTVQMLTGGLVVPWVVSVALSSPVLYTDLTQFNTVTVSWDGDPVPPGGDIEFLLITDVPSASFHIGPVGVGANSVSTTRAATPDWFGAGGTEYVLLQASDGAGPAVTLGNVTVTWSQ
jgi:hypothetical protein